MLNDTFDPDNNNFDLIRLVAALIVTFGHTYALANNEQDPISAFLSYGFSGTLSVWAFLFISGFLIARSEQRSSTTDFVIARFVRIYPAFFAVIILETFLIIPIFYEKSLHEYFQHWALPHLLNVLVWPQNPGVPNVFTALPHPVVNGSLWTIPLELSFYMTYLIAVAVARAFRAAHLLLLAASIIGEITLNVMGIGYDSPQPTALNGISIYQYVVYSSYFFAGVCAWHYREYIRISAGWTAVAFFAAFAARNTPIAPFVLKFALPYLLLVIGTSGRLGTIIYKRFGDFSYGIYLVSYPITNSVVALTGQRLSSLVVFLISLLPIFALAFASWHLIEKRGKKLRGWLRAQLQQLGASRQSRLAVATTDEGSKMVPSDAGPKA